MSEESATEGAVITSGGMAMSNKRVVQLIAWVTVDEIMDDDAIPKTLSRLKELSLKALEHPEFKLRK